MNRFNTTKMDSKGRILVPFYIRDFLDLNEGNEFVLICNGKKELKVYPIDGAENAQIKLLMKDQSETLTKALRLIDKHKIDILVSTSKTLDKGKKAEWSGMVDFSSCEDIREFENEINKLNGIKKIEINQNKL